MGGVRALKIFQPKAGLISIFRYSHHEKKNEFFELHIQANLNHQQLKQNNSNKKKITQKLTPGRLLIWECKHAISGISECQQAI